MTIVTLGDSSPPAAISEPPAALIAAVVIDMTRTSCRFLPASGSHLNHFPDEDAMGASARSFALTRYDAACKALSAAVSVDEALKIRNVHEAYRAYARQAKNKQLEIDAAEIRIRAERRIGELMKAQKDAGLMSKGAKGNPGGQGAKIVRDDSGPAQITLEEVGIDKHLADRARKYAAVPAEEWEQEMEDWRERVSEENNRVSARLEKRGETLSRTERKECDIEVDVMDAYHTCPTCGQKLPKGDK